MENTAGISEDQLRRAAKSAVCKINIDSDGRLAMTAAIRQVFVEKPGEFDPRNYLGPAREKLKELYKHKVDKCSWQRREGVDFCPPAPLKG